LPSGLAKPVPRRPLGKTSRFMLRRALLALGLLFAATHAAAGFPAGYKPNVIQPTGVPDRWEFDLTAALARAKAENKRLYLYLGANDCPFCRKYEAFLEANSNALAPHFAKDYLVFDLRSTLKAQADKLRFRIGDQSWAYKEFMTHLNDERVRALVYPSVWLLDANAKPLMQMPAGTGTFETVPEQLEILRLEQ
jgi:thioredoxin-related protein